MVDLQAQWSHSSNDLHSDHSMASDVSEYYLFDGGMLEGSMPLMATGLSESLVSPIVAGGHSGHSSNSSDIRNVETRTEEGFRIAFRTKSEKDVLDDGYKWRKYGKKTVKSSPNPRNYYRCSTEGCLVKKRVERDPEDPSYVITTYEGTHNHTSPGVVYYTTQDNNSVRHIERIRPSLLPLAQKKGCSKRISSNHIHILPPWPPTKPTTRIPEKNPQGKKKRELLLPFFSPERNYGRGYDRSGRLLLFSPSLVLSWHLSHAEKTTEGPRHGHQEEGEQVRQELEEAVVRTGNLLRGKRGGEHGRGEEAGGAQGAERGGEVRAAFQGGAAGPHALFHRAPRPLLQGRGARAAQPPRPCGHGLALRSSLRRSPTPCCRRCCDCVDTRRLGSARGRAGRGRGRAHSRRHRAARGLGRPWWLAGIGMNTS